MENTSTFLDLWNQYMFVGGGVLVVIGVLIFLYHEFKILQIKDYKERYDYVNLHEIRYFLYAVIACVVAGAFLINTIGSNLILHYGQRWFYVRAGLSICFIIVGYFVFYNLIRIYYPKKLSRRLEKLRSTPRVSPQGNTMRRLTEAEEDLHLERSQIKEEDIQVVDYDVWIDDKTGYKKIEKYVISEQAVECPECGFYTMEIASEEMGKSPTDLEPGYLIEHLACSYCNHRERKEIVVAQLSTNVA
jgi:hypothetical protein